MEMHFFDVGQIGSFWALVTAIFSIIVIDLILAGDNAVVIAMAVRSLPRKKRKLGIALGAGVAVVLRIILTFFAAKLLQVVFLKLIGGLLIIWIAIKLLLTSEKGTNKHRKEAAKIWEAVWIILVADLTMSLDNVLAVAGASKGSLLLLIFGLGLSIPLVVFASSVLSTLMDKYPIILFLGAAILGKVGGEMIITDKFVHDLLEPGRIVEYGVQVFFAVFVVVFALYLKKRKTPKKIPTP